ncbi:MAG: nuclear transport factor 2 family protein [Bacteroidia bacterium]|nr:nuclear transport factor 2 family protein [Bacteroidia bacterium]
MSNRRSIAKNYLKFLQNGDMDQLLQLFSQDAIVDSPLYGLKKASDFYRELQTDTQDSKLELLKIFEAEKSTNMALYFTYKWTLKNQEVVSFEVVDIIEFNDSDKIQKLKIIYDTVLARTLVKQLKN